MTRWRSRRRAAWRRLGRASRRRAVCIAMVAALSLAGSALLTAAAGVPAPRIHDEFSYLLAADTFAHGRLANPTHPRWQHFESFHIIHEPTYASKFPPAQGLALALGQALTGQPIVGVWLGTAAMCAAMLWMFYAWMPPRWALLAALLVTLQIGVIGYWCQSYWGGSLAALGGALLFGGLRRVVDTARVRDALLMGVGLAVLANSRPLEGLLVSAPAALLLAVWGVRRMLAGRWPVVVKAALPVAVVLAPTFAAMAYYNQRTTGSAWRTPYQVYDRLYNRYPKFVFQQPRNELKYRHKAMDDFYHSKSRRADLRSRVERQVEDWLHSGLWLWAFYLGPALSIPLVAAPLALGRRWLMFALAAMAPLAVTMLLAIWTKAHYVAPAACLLYVLVIYGLRQLRLCRHRLWRRPVPISAIVALAVVWFLGHAAGYIAWSRGPGRNDWPNQRAGIQARLQSEPGKHLVIVRYSDTHYAFNEWVYNRADIDASKVVWARQMDAAGDAALVQYFKDRHVWLLEPDRPDPAPVEYSP